MFPHSFEPSDVTVLLERIHPQYLDKAERDALIASGAHYNELLSKEAVPSQEEMALFHRQVEAFGDQMAVMVNGLAEIIMSVEKAPVLVSLVRAGTPTGILVKRALARKGVDAPHYSVSIVQGRGFDVVAIGKILETGVNPSQLIFIDGWTGKGVVRRELSAALKALEPIYGAFRDELFVLSDIAGVADHAVTRNDTLIPSALLSGPLCGLVSRTVYRGTQEEPQIHAAAYLDYMEHTDVSRSFINEMDARMKRAEGEAMEPVRPASNADVVMKGFLAKIVEAYGLKSVNNVKPGVGESSRLFLRKKPKLLLVENELALEVLHLVSLAREKGVEIEVVPNMPYLACTLM